MAPGHHAVCLSNLLAQRATTITQHLPVYTQVATS